MSGFLHIHTYTSMAAYKQHVNFYPVHDKVQEKTMISSLHNKEKLGAILHVWCAAILWRSQKLCCLGINSKS